MPGLRVPARSVPPLLVALLFAAAALPTGGSPTDDGCGLVPFLGGCPEWTRRTTGATVDEVPSVSVLSADGDVLVQATAGGTVPGRNDMVVVTATRTADGTELWTRSTGLQGTVFPFDVAHDASDGSVYVALMFEEQDGYGAVLMRIDETTGETWGLITPPGPYDHGILDVEAANGRVYATAIRGSDLADSFEVVVTARSADATPLWTRTLDPTPGMDFAFHAALGPDGDRLFLALTADHDRSGALHTVALDTDDGTVLWDAAHGNEHEGIGIQIHVAPDGEAVYLASTLGAYANDATTGGALWRYEFYDPIVWSGLHFPFPSALSGDGTTLLLSRPADADPGGHHVQATVLDTETGRGRGGLGFAYVPSEDTWAFSAALSPDGGTAYFAGSSETTFADALTAGSAYIVAFSLGGGGSGGHLMLETGAPSAVTGLHLSPDGTRLYATGHTTLLDGSGYLHATAYAR